MALFSVQICWLFLVGMWGHSRPLCVHECVLESKNESICVTQSRMQRKDYCSTASLHDISKCQSELMHWTHVPRHSHQDRQYFVRYRSLRLPVKDSDSAGIGKAQNKPTVMPETWPLRHTSGSFERTAQTIANQDVTKLKGTHHDLLTLVFHTSFRKTNPVQIWFY